VGASAIEIGSNRWSDHGGVLVNLNTLVAVNSGFTLTDAIAIDDSGQILCHATNAHRTERAVLSTPN
jgi:hypothetical protein